MTTPSSVPSVSVAKKQQHSVPVIVDDPKWMGNFNMTRCVYFHIDCEDTLDEWTMDLGSGGIPFRMIGLSGVIVQPFDGSLIFEYPQQVDDLFSMVQKVPAESETDSMMHVELEEIWLPNDLLLMSQGKAIRRGDVFRIGYRLFRLAFAFTIGRLTQDEFLQQSMDPNQIQFSEKETTAIAAWVRYEIEMADTSAQESKLYLPQKSGQKEK
jgi:hypothetical protein